MGEVVDVMLAHGYGEDAVHGYLGGNFMRVLGHAAAGADTIHDQAHDG